jgi:hypothetical protein
MYPLSQIECPDLTWTFDLAEKKAFYSHQIFIRFEGTTDVGINYFLKEHSFIHTCTLPNYFPNIDNPERTKQMEEILNFQKPSEGLELVILLHTQY